MYDQYKTKLKLFSYVLFFIYTIGLFVRFNILDAIVLLFFSIWIFTMIQNTLIRLTLSMFIQSPLQKDKNEQAIIDTVNKEKAIAEISERVDGFDYSKIPDEFFNKSERAIASLPKQVIVPRPQEVLLSGENQVKFIDSQYGKMWDYIYERANTSTLPKDNSFLLSLKSDNEDYLDALFNRAYKELRNQPLANGINFLMLHDAKNNESFLAPLKELYEKYYIIKPSNKSIELSIQAHSKFLGEMFAYINQQSAILNKGNRGEAKVNEHLNLYNDILTNFSNIRFETDGTSVEADNIVITPNGVFCIEVKNYGNENETIEITKDGKWKRFKGGYEVPTSNVTDQHNRHIGIMQRVINKELKNKGFDIPYIEFRPIYVIANDDVEIVNDCDDITVVRASNIYPYIKRQNNEYKLNQEVQQAICEIILEQRKELIKYPYLDYVEPFSNQFNNLMCELEKKSTIEQVYQEYINCIEKTGSKVKLKNLSNQLYIDIE